MPNTNAPVPVSSVTADAKFALVGVARKVATPVPNPLIPVLTGKPVAFVRVAEVGVPNIGVTKVGDVDKTVLPVPVDVVTPVPPLTTGNTPVISAVDKLIASQDVLVPSVCRYLFACPVCTGNKAFKPVLAVVCPVPPLTIGKVPVMSAVEMSSVSHALLVPSVFKYLPVLPVCVGARALKPALAVICPVPPKLTGTVLKLIVEALTTIGDCPTYAIVPTGPTVSVVPSENVKTRYIEPLLSTISTSVTLRPATPRSMRTIRLFPSTTTTFCIAIFYPLKNSHTIRTNQEH